MHWCQGDVVSPKKLLAVYSRRLLRMFFVSKELLPLFTASPTSFASYTSSTSTSSTSHTSSTSPTSVYYSQSNHLHSESEGSNPLSRTLNCQRLDGYVSRPAACFTHPPNHNINRTGCLNLQHSTTDIITSILTVVSSLFNPFNIFFKGFT